jgi:hypothetical protein
MEKAEPAGKKARGKEQPGGKASTTGSRHEKKPKSAAPEPAGRERRAPVAADGRAPKTPPLKPAAVEPRKASRTGSPAESKTTKSAASGGVAPKSSGKQPPAGKQPQTAKGPAASAKAVSKGRDEDEYYSSSYSDDEGEESYSPAGSASGSVDSNDI